MSRFKKPLSGLSRLSDRVGGGAKIIPGQMEWTTPGTYSFWSPVDIEIGVVCVGAGGLRSGTTASGGGGGLSWGNFLLPAGVLVPIQVGAMSATLADRHSYFGTYIVANGGHAPAGGSSGGTHRQGGGTGGAGGAGSTGGGGGAGGYSGNGGEGGAGSSIAGSDGSGGGGGGGWSGVGGGGVGIYGEGPSGSGGKSAPDPTGKGGSGGDGGSTGLYGGGVAASAVTSPQRGTGAVRIIWGAGRSFPFNAGDV